MTIIKCDTCGKQVENLNCIREINAFLKSDGINEYCDDCHYKLEKYLTNLKEVHAKVEVDSCITYLKNIKNP